MKVIEGRCLLAAGIVRDYRFRSRTCYDVYLDRLESCGLDYEILDLVTCDNGSILARIVTQYNQVDLIDLT